MRGAFLVDYQKAARLERDQEPTKTRKGRLGLFGAATEELVPVRKRSRHAATGSCSSSHFSNL
jgi:hypothetical protein